MAGRFDRNPIEICLIFNEILSLVFNTHHHRLESLEQPFLSAENLSRYADSIHAHGAPLQNCFGFIDGTVRKIARPNTNQRTMYNGYKRFHGMKFQSVVVPDGLIANLSGPYEWRRHDSTMLHQSGLLPLLEQHICCLHWDPTMSLIMEIVHTHLVSIYKGHIKTANLPQEWSYSTNQ